MRVFRNSVFVIALGLVAPIALGACSDDSESAKASDASAQVDTSLVPASFPMPEGAEWTDAYSMGEGDSEKVLATANVEIPAEDAVAYFEENLEGAGYEIVDVNGLTVAFEDEDGNAGTVQAATDQTDQTTVYVTVAR